MVGRILFLSAAAYLAYRYIGRSNKKARELRESSGAQEVLSAAHEPIGDQARLLPSEAATEPGKAARTLVQTSTAAEPER
ncbi:MAG TPA: hypothetical protein VES20_04480 [Bryobacteraceae bacterium]|nr:hypothetical protein [Bryobacteraceae bacterium]